MKKRRRMAIGLVVVVYAVGVALALLALGAKTRYDCFARHGVRGVFWCPESAGAAAPLIRRSLLWPYHLARAIPGEIVK